jgi:methionyl aminopeptidase
MVEGMTLAIEVIYSAGSPDLVVSSDGWTLVTVDGSLSGLFEHTVALTTSGPIVLTDWMGSGNI